MKPSTMITILVVLMSGAADQHTRAQVTFTGFGAAGFRLIDRERFIEINNEVYYEGKLQANIRVNNHIRAQLDFRGNSSDQLVELREFSAEFSYVDRLDIEFGNIKDPFGAERLESEEDLATIDRSVLSESVSLIGYGRRNVGLTVHRSFDKDNPGFPHEYHLHAFKNNNNQTGLVGRYTHHFGDYEASLNYSLLNTGGDFPIVSHGFAAHMLYDVKDFEIDGEIMVVQDPIEGVRRQLVGRGSTVYALGGRVSAARGFDTDGAVIEEIEPLVLFSYFRPDSDVPDAHTLQVLLGANVYFEKEVRARVNFDLHMTRNQFNPEYSSSGSRLILELQVRF
jgi:hypothetical protein